MSFYRVMLVTLGMLLSAGMAQALATPSKLNNPAKVAKLCSAEQVNYLAKVMAVEALHSEEGYVSVAHAVLVRASARKDYSIKAAATAPHQFAPLVKQPTPRMRELAEQMCRDWLNGKPTVAVPLQRKLAGCSYFHTPWVNPKWAQKFKKLGGYCGKIAGHHLYRDPRNPVYAYAR